MSIVAPVLDSIVVAGVKVHLPHPDAHGVLMTGPVMGEVVIGDTLYDLTHDWIPVLDEDHHALLGDRIGRMHQVIGTYGPDWTHNDPDPHGGAEMWGKFTAAAAAYLDSTAGYAGVGAPPGPFTSLALHLCTADPGRSAPTNEVTGGSYAAQTFTMATSSQGAGGTTKASSSTATFSGMPAVTVAGCWFASLTAAMTATHQLSIQFSSSVTLLVGQSLTIASGALSDLYS